MEMEQQSTVLIAYKALIMSHQLLYWTHLCSSSIIMCVMHCPSTGLYIKHKNKFQEFTS